MNLDKNKLIASQLEMIDKSEHVVAKELTDEERLELLRKYESKKQEKIDE